MEPDINLQSNLFTYLINKYGKSTNSVPITEEIYVDDELIINYNFTACSSTSTFMCDKIGLSGDLGDTFYLAADGQWG